jgi:uncharacterized protein YyaL (SSP411 family)
MDTHQLLLEGKHIEGLMRRFELKKCLVREYEGADLKPVSDEQVDAADYALFSKALLRAYHATKDLRFINTLLKLDSSHAEALRIIEAL